MDFGLDGAYAGRTCDTLPTELVHECMHLDDGILEEHLEEESCGQHHLEEHIQKHYILRRRFHSFVARLFVTHVITSSTCHLRHFVITRNRGYTP